MDNWRIQVAEARAMDKAILDLLARTRRKIKRIQAALDGQGQPRAVQGASSWREGTFVCPRGIIT